MRRGSYSDIERMQGQTALCGGYVLLLTLILLMMVGVGLASVARQSHAAAVEAGRQEAELQRRWLARTAEDLLPHVDDWLRADAESLGVPRPALRWTSTINGHEVQLTVADEQAKANVNALWERSEPAAARPDVEDLLRAAEPAAFPRLRPVEDFHVMAAAAKSDWATFSSYEQLWPPEAVRSIVTSVGNEAALHHVTLWGDGRLNVARASRISLEAVLQPLLARGQLEELIRWQNAAAVVAAGSESAGTGHPIAPAALNSHDLLNSLELTERQAGEVARLITTESRSFSVRLIIDDSFRKHTYLTVHTTDVGGDAASWWRARW